MVMAKLWVICGNCGNGDKDLFENSVGYGEIYISCNNCSTLHALELEEKEDK